MPWLLLLLCLTLPVPLLGQELDPAAAKKAAINKAHVRKYIEQSKKEEVSILKTLDALAGKVGRAQKKLRTTQQNFKGTKALLYQSQKEVERLQSEADHYLQAMTGQMESLYILHRVWAITLMPGLMGDDKFLRNQQLLRRTTALGANQLEKLQLTLQKLEKQEEILKNSSAQLGYYTEEEARISISMELEQRHLKDYLRRLRRDRALKQRYLAESKGELIKLEGVIQKYSSPAGSPRKRKKTLDKNGIYHETEPQFQGFRGLKGHLPKPMAGSLEQKFGKGGPFGGLYKKGILVQVQGQEPAKAILGGKIAFAGPFRGFGRMVILDHGKGSMSLYGNLSELNVQKGDLVTQGQSLGFVRRHPEAGKPLFYFETRYRARAEDPMGWLKSTGWKD